MNGAHDVGVERDARSPAEWRLRPATGGDLAALTAMMREFYAGSGLALDAARARGAFATLVGSPRLGRVWLAEQQGAAAGYVVLTVCYGM